MSTAQSLHLADYYYYDAPVQDSRGSTAQSLELADKSDHESNLIASEVSVPSSSAAPSNVQTQLNTGMPSVKFLLSCIPVHYNEAMINAELSNGSFTCPYDLE